MAEIRVLSPTVASQIAAGEVVERPASAAKEIIENALDAGASRCDVSCVDGGVSRLVVSDDGAGMLEAEARLALLRHATSKLTELADLAKINSFGFRGEALPSIASVCRLILSTRARGADNGVCLHVDAGIVNDVRPQAMPPGTAVEIRDLFFNVPARRKFLRSMGTESSHITSVVEGAALTRPEVTFTLERDGRRVRELLRVDTRGDRVMQLFVDQDLAEIDGERGPLRLQAHLSRPERARAGTAGLWLVVNGRIIKDRMLSVTVAQAYGSVLPSGHYPRGVVYVDLPPQLLDVNVHPQKTEVRFVDPRALADAVYSLLSRGLSQAFSLPPSTRSQRRPSESLVSPRGAQSPAAVLPALGWSSPREPQPPTATELDPWGLVPGTSAPENTGRALESVGLEPSIPGALGVAESPSVALDSTVRWRQLRFLAQIRATYLVCEGPDGLYVLDQHAAAERVSFHRLLVQYRNSATSSQALLFPTSVDLSQAEVELVEQHQSTLVQVGLDVRTRGPERVSIHSVPRLLHRASPERLLFDLLSELTKSGTRGFSAAIEHALALMACHGSLRAGEAVTATQAEALLSALDEVDFAGHCAHGRPVVALIGFSELERKVGRR